MDIDGRRHGAPGGCSRGQPSNLRSFPAAGIRQARLVEIPSVTRCLSLLLKYGAAGRVLPTPVKPAANVLAGLDNVDGNGAGTAWWLAGLVALLSLALPRRLDLELKRWFPAVLLADLVEGGL